MRPLLLVLVLGALALTSAASGAIEDDRVHASFFDEPQRRANVVDPSSRRRYMESFQRFFTRATASAFFGQSFTRFFTRAVFGVFSRTFSVSFTRYFGLTFARLTLTMPVQTLEPTAYPSRAPTPNPLLETPEGDVHYCLQILLQQPTGGQLFDFVGKLHGSRPVYKFLDHLFFYDANFGYWVMSTNFDPGSPPSLKVSVLQAQYFLALLSQLILPSYLRYLTQQCSHI